MPAGKGRVPPGKSPLPAHSCPAKKPVLQSGYGMWVWLPRVFCWLTPNTQSTRASEQESFLVAVMVSQSQNDSCAQTWRRRERGSAVKAATLRRISFSLPRRGISDTLPIRTSGTARDTRDGSEGHTRPSCCTERKVANHSRSSICVSQQRYHCCFSCFSVSCTTVKPQQVGGRSFLLYTQVDFEALDRPLLLRPVTPDLLVEP